MKSLKWIALSVTGILLLSGCYTQLEYSQRMNRITQYKSAESYYDQDDRSNQDYNGTTRQQTRQYADKGYDDYGNEEEYIPVYYKDYETAAWYDSYRYSNPFVYGTNHYRYVNEHALYAAYQEGYLDGFSDGTGYFGPVFYSGYYGMPLLRPFSYDWYLAYGRFYRMGYNFSYWWSYPHISFYHHSHYFSYIYGPFAWPHGTFITYNFYYFGNSGSNYSSNLVANRRYGPRSIGTNRVSTDRTRSVDRSRGNVSRSSGTSYINTRSRSAVRSRGTSNRSTSSGTYSRTRSTNTGRSVQRTRSTNSGRSGSGSVQRNRNSGNNSDNGSTSARKRVREQDSKSTYQSRSRYGYIVIPRSRISSSGNERNGSQIQSRLRDSKVKPPVRSNSNFWNRVRSYMNNNVKNSTYSLPNRSIKTRSSSSGTSIKRSTSSSNSRSRSSSSNSRKRSSGNDNSSSNRSRGGN